MQGFKSFDRKVSIPLSKGFTAIVGPNGSGKSNVVDAICFVLGRSSAKSLRAERLTHLLYSGGKGRKAAKAMEVSLHLDNRNRDFPYDKDEVIITRRLTKGGTATYKINNERLTKAQLTDILSSNMFDPEGHNIVMQGDITNFIEMRPSERREIIDDLSGISEYNAKRDRAQKDLDGVELRTKELVIIMSERKKHLDELRKEKKDAEQYQSLKTEHADLEANLAFTKLSELKEEEGGVKEKIDGKESEIESIKSELDALDKKLETKETELKGLENELIKAGGEEHMGLQSKIERLKGRISVNDSKGESKKSEIGQIDTLITRLQGVSEDEAGRVNVLKEKIKGIHGTVGSLYSVPEKYATAIESAVGYRANYIVVDHEDVALEAIDYLKEHRMGRATFLPLNKIRGPPSKNLKDRNILGSAVSLISAEQKYKDIFAYVLGNTQVVTELRKTKHLLKKFRMVSLDGDIAEKSGAMKGGSFKKKQRKGEDFEEYTKSRDKLLDEIEELQLENESLNKELEGLQSEYEEKGLDFKGMKENREKLDKEVDSLKQTRQELSSNFEHHQRSLGDLRVEKARLDAKLSDVELNMKKFKEREFKKGDIQSMESRIRDITQEIVRLEPVNMKAIDLYAEVEVEYADFEGKFSKLQTERKSVLDFIEEIEDKKKDVFMEVFTQIADGFSGAFPKLSPKGKAELKLEDEENPLEGGLLVEAQPAGKKLRSIEAMSGGEKVIVALAFLFALQKYKPMPFYVLDEVDAALDQKNSMRFVELLKTLNAQLIVISHNNSVIRHSEKLYGVSMLESGISQVIGIDLDDTATQKKYLEKNKGTKANFEEIDGT